MSLKSINMDHNNPKWGTVSQRGPFFRRYVGMSQPREGRPLQLAIAIAMVAIGMACGQTIGQDSRSLTTEDRLEDAGWWPTKGDSARSGYVGAAACEGCHVKVAALQETTAMYHAGVRAAQSQTLKMHEQLEFKEGGYRYSLVRGVSGVTYAVTDGANSVTGAVDWAFGAGEIGQTYLLEKSGSYTEGRLSYYTGLSGLDITIGQAADVPLETVKTLGQKMNHDAAQRCFGCHTTASVTSGIFEPQKATPGLSCEACHGPGAAHVAAAKAQNYERASATIVNPSRLAPSDSVDFCGACHRTWSDVAMQMPANLGLFSLRFQPYRLEKSRCWGNNGDGRITCIACHDPHQPLVREPMSYDSKCLACHSARGQSQRQTAMAPACKVSTGNCVSCHMPKYEVPQTHAFFTDHYIRVVHAGAGFPP
jgi:hypothetical protein